MRFDEASAAKKGDADALALALSEEEPETATERADVVEPDELGALAELESVWMGTGVCDGDGDGRAKETAPPADESGVGESADESAEVSAPPVAAARESRKRTRRFTEAKREPLETTRAAARDTTASARKKAAMRKQTASAAHAAQTAAKMAICCEWRARRLGQLEERERAARAQGAQGRLTADCHVCARGQRGEYTGKRAGFGARCRLRPLRRGGPQRLTPLPSFAAHDKRSRDGSSVGGLL